MRQDNFSFAVIFPKKRQNYLVLSVDILCIKALKTRFCDIFDMNLVTSKNQ